MLLAKGEQEGTKKTKTKTKKNHKTSLLFLNPQLSATTGCTETLISSVLKSKGRESSTASTSACDYTVLSPALGETGFLFEQQPAGFPEVPSCKIYWAHTHHFELHAAHKTRRCIRVGRSWREGVLAWGLPVLKMLPASTHCGQTGVSVQTQSSQPKPVKSHRIQRWLCLKKEVFF